MIDQGGDPCSERVFTPEGEDPEAGYPRDLK